MLLKKIIKHNRRNKKKKKKKRRSNEERISTKTTGKEGLKRQWTKSCHEKI